MHSVSILGMILLGSSAQKPVKRTYSGSYQSRIQYVTNLLGEGIATDWQHVLVKHNETARHGASHRDSLEIPGFKTSRRNVSITIKSMLENPKAKEQRLLQERYAICAK